MGTNAGLTKIRCGIEREKLRGKSLEIVEFFPGTVKRKQTSRTRGILERHKPCLTALARERLSANKCVGNVCVWYAQKDVQGPVPAKKKTYRKLHIPLGTTELEPWRTHCDTQLCHANRYSNFCFNFLGTALFQTLHWRFMKSFMMNHCLFNSSSTERLLMINKFAFNF